MPAMSLIGLRRFVLLLNSPGKSIGMDVWTLVLDVGVLLGVAWVLGSLFAWLGQSPILGYLLAGVLLVPGMLHLVQSESEVAVLAELGISENVGGTLYFLGSRYNLCHSGFD